MIQAGERTEAAEAVQQDTPPQERPMGPTAEAWTDDVATPGLLRRMAALLDRDGREVAERTVLPRGWHVGLFPTGLAQSALRPDGYAGPGVALPDLGLPRVMLGGRRAAYAGDIPLGATVRRRTTIESVTEKTGRSGGIAVVTVLHALSVGGREVVTEREDYILRQAAPPHPEPAAPREEIRPPRPCDVARTLVPDETLLFRFCAVTFNAHRIHYDAPYATGREGYPALVVNGALTALLALELVREAAGREPAAFGYRTLAPLHAGRPMHLKARQEAGEWRAWAEDETGTVALEATFR
ncbi:MaoC family dehydratase N-terminal domain-containing protein [Methylobacterium sp. EM32]|uniref:FAS1-like dehydratase domain-containing protein n=1 Tax=Methylobacterium sp. EM32 TaxID=3163481 RepID=UPI0033AB0B99